DGGDRGQSMVKEIRIYIEGGGNQSTTKARLRHGFHGFFRDVVTEIRAAKIRFNLIVCGSRRASFEAFHRAISVHPQASNLLLVDSEGPVSLPVWEHL